MPWKFDKDNKIELRDGNPVWIDSAGAEMGVAGDTISRLNNEAKTNREAKESAEVKLKAFDGLDAAIARKAVETVSKIDAKKLIDAGEVDKVKDQIKGEFTAQIGERDKKIGDMQSRLDGMVMSAAFKGSKFISSRIAVPAEMFEATFARNFKVEDGRVVPYSADGNKIMSSKRLGEVADIEEAFEKIVEIYPYKDSILKATSASGSGSNGGGGQRGAARYVKRADFDKFSPMDQAATAAAASKGEVSIID